LHFVIHCNSSFSHWRLRRASDKFCGMQPWLDVKGIKKYARHKSGIKIS
jgi:hypothetical protein